MQLYRTVTTHQTNQTKTKTKTTRARSRPKPAVSLKHDGTDGPAYTDWTAGLVADGTDYKDVSAQ